MSHAFLSHAGRHLLCRRHFLQWGGTGLGGIALSSLLADSAAAEDRSPLRPAIDPAKPFATRDPHWKPAAAIGSQAGQEGLRGPCRATSLVLAAVCESRCPPPRAAALRCQAAHGHPRLWQSRAGIWASPADLSPGGGRAPRRILLPPRRGLPCAPLR